jgi:hypothetical protein
MGPAAMAQKKARVLEALRAERGVAAPPSPDKASPDQPREPANAEPATQKPDTPTHDQDSQPANPDPMDQFRREYQARETDLKNLKEAADARIAAASEKEALAAQKLEKMEQALQSPLEFIAETGMTEDQWREFLAGGGKLTAEQQRVRALEKSHSELMSQIEGLNKSMAEREARAAQATEAAQIEGALGKYPLVARLGGVRNVQAALQQLRTQNPGVTALQAIQHLDTGYKASITKLLSEKEIGDMFASSVPKPTTTRSAEPHHSPSTLTKQVSSSTDPATTLPGPLDWAAKRALVLRRLAQERQRA